MTPRIVLDTGGLEAWAGSRPPGAVVTLMEVARRGRSTRIIVPSIVLAEALTGTARDVAIDRMLKHLVVEEQLPVTHARRAAVVRQGTGASAVDAVVAEAVERHEAEYVITSDPGDLSALLERTDADTVVIAV